MFRRAKRVLKQIGWKESSRLSLLLADEQALITRIRKRNLTYLSDAKLANLADSCRSVEKAGTPGLFIEAGCALGGSTILLATLKDQQRRMQVYDVFGMIPPPTLEDTKDVHGRYAIIIAGASKGIGGEKYYGYQSNLYEIVSSNLIDFGINCETDRLKLIQGLVQDTLWIDQPVAFAHIDVDWYEPVMTCLQRIIPFLAVGGIVILDDYHDWGGCKKAVDEYFQQAPRRNFIMDDSARSMKITRVAS